MLVSRGRGVWISVALASLVLAGCGTRMTRAPVEDRGTAVAAQPGEVVVSPVVKTLPGAENAGRPGYYTVKAGDTLFRIALDNGQNWRDIQAWNSLTNPNALEVGQVLRVQPPGASTTAAAPAGPTTSPVTSSGVSSRPLSETAPPAASTSPTTPPAPAPAPAAGGADEISFIWPAQGTVITPFDVFQTQDAPIAIACANDALFAVVELSQSFGQPCVTRGFVLHECDDFFRIWTVINQKVLEFHVAVFGNETIQ